MASYQVSSHIWRALWEACKGQGCPTFEVLPLPTTSWRS